MRYVVFMNYRKKKYYTIISLFYIALRHLDNALNAIYYIFNISPRQGLFFFFYFLSWNNFYI